MCANSHKINFRWFWLRRAPQLCFVGSSFTPTPGGAKNRITLKQDEFGTAKITLLPHWTGVNKLIFQAISMLLFVITNGHINLLSFKVLRNTY